MKALKVKERRRRGARWREAEHERLYWHWVRVGEEAVARGDVEAAREAVANVKSEWACRVEAMVEAL